MRFLEIELTSPQPAELLRFYATQLELETDDDRIVVGTTTVRVTAGASPPYHLAFTIPENQIEEAQNWLSHRVELLRNEIFDFDAWNARAVYFEDPDGNVLELIARRDLANTTSEPFASRSLLSVSEVGLAVEDVAQVVRALEDALELPVYSGNRTTFAAVGSHDGLLIVVPAGHRWFPSDRAAHSAPLRAFVTAPRDGETCIDGSYSIVGRKVSS